jgi:hypothetical protein
MRAQRYATGPTVLRECAAVVSSEGRRSLLITALRLQARGGPHAELARQVVLLCLFAELLAAAGHDGPPHRGFGPPRSDARRRAGRRGFRESLAGRRPRG